ncbi:AAA family ATPase [Marinimicrobium sp. ARAG 43.8]|uniref:AAA family ATPase n=1 Tax=Marinimicrobium sp. ARAG 43.8 TaxID=3418719 RepID=UPI003CEBC879
MPYLTDRLQDEALQQSTRETDGPAVFPSRFRFDPLAVSAQLRDGLQGQEEALSVVSDELMRIKADIGEPGRPLAVFLLAGPTGVGKTETVRLLAKALHGQTDAFCRVDMGTLTQDHYTAAITGAPPGYAGSRESHTLIDETHIRGNFSTPGVVLFDELEKAGPEVLRSLLGVLDYGQLRLTSGQKVLDFRNSLVFMTTNLGSRELTRCLERSQRWYWLGRGSIQKRQLRYTVHRALQNGLDPEFLNRIDHTLVYYPLATKNQPAIVERLLRNLNQRLARKRVAVSLSDRLCEQLVSEGFDPRYGARSMKRHFRKMVETPVARHLLTENFQVSDSGEKAGVVVYALHCDWREGRVFVSALDVERPLRQITQVQG